MKRAINKNFRESKTNFTPQRKNLKQKSSEYSDIVINLPDKSPNNSLPNITTNLSSGEDNSFSINTRSVLYLTPKNKSFIIRSSNNTTSKPTTSKSTTKLYSGVNSPLVSMNKLSVEELSLKYEEWMKIAADKKITTTNTWDFALIDYFYQFNLFKDKDNNINFLKASCALEGCVKIYTSRVDSLVTEAGKLIVGLGNSSEDIQNKDKNAKNANLDDVEDNNDLEQQMTTKKKQQKPSNTLVTNKTSITIKEHEIEFFDPMFKKLCIKQGLSSETSDVGVNSSCSSLLLTKLSFGTNLNLMFENDIKLSSEDKLNEENKLEINPTNNLKHIKEELANINLNQLKICPSVTDEMFDFDNSYTGNFVLDEEINLKDEAQNNSYSNNDSLTEEMDIEDPYLDTNNDFFIDNNDVLDVELELGDTDGQIHNENITKRVVFNKKNSLGSYFDYFNIPNKYENSLNVKKIRNIDDVNITNVVKRKNTKKAESEKACDFLSLNDITQTLKKLKPSNLFVKNLEFLNKEIIERHDYLESNDIKQLFFPFTKKYNSSFGIVPVSSNNQNTITNNNSMLMQTSMAKSFMLNNNGDQTINNFSLNFKANNTTFILNNPNSTMINFGDNMISKVSINPQPIKLNITTTNNIMDMHQLKSKMLNEIKESEECGDPDNISEAKFNKLISKLNQKYKEDNENFTSNAQVNDKSSSKLSKAYCLIALLHVANENGYDLETSVDYNDIAIKI